MSSSPISPTVVTSEAELLHCLDVRRVRVHDRFFSVFSFDSGEELLQAVDALEIDLDRIAEARDLRRDVLSGSLYWLLFLKGYLQFEAAGRVEDSNIYFRYLVQRFDAKAHDPGIADLLADSEQARLRIERRFLDVRLFRRLIVGDLSELHRVAPVELALCPPGGERAATVFKIDSDRPVVGELDGYHRVFTARLFGVPWLPCRFVGDESEQAAVGDAIDRLVRFTIPFDAHVVALPEPGHIGVLGHRRVAHLRAEMADNRPTKAALARSLAEIESARDSGAEFLLLPTSTGSISGAALADECDSRYRRVAREEGIGAVYFLGGVQAAGEHSAPVPLPPPEMTHLAIGMRDPTKLEGSGRVGLEAIQEVLAANGASLDDFDSILDFGSGCGRLIRHLDRLPAAIYGADYNPYLVNWCKANLPFARFFRTSLTPGLPLADASLDFVFAVATFSHFDQSIQSLWLRELARALRPGGLLLVTVHGAGRAAELQPELQKRFDTGELVVIRPELSGTNACAAYHPEAYLRGSFSAGLELVDYLPGGARDVRQDALLLRKPETPIAG
jgi:SAM-dependent methyltransferase